jgi:hypothetical protein
VAAVALVQVLWPRLFYPLLVERGPESIQLIVPFLLLALLLMKAWPRTTHIGAPAMALIVGVGAAVAVGGAVIGTLSPQSFATVNAFELSGSPNPIAALINGALVLVGVVTTLAYFHFSGRVADDGVVRRPVLIEWVSRIGAVFIAITLGVLFAGVYIAALTALVDRWAAIRESLAMLWAFLQS